VAEPIDGGSAQDAVGEGISPLGQIKVAGDDSGAAFVAFRDHVVQVLVLGRPQGLEAEVVDDKQAGLGQLVELAFVGVGGSGSVKFREHFALGCKHDVMAEPDGAVAQGLGDMAFAGSAGSHDKDRDIFIHEPTGGQIHDQGLVDGRIERKVEVFQGLLVAEVSPA